MNSAEGINHENPHTFPHARVVTKHMACTGDAHTERNVRFWKNRFTFRTFAYLNKEYQSWKFTVLWFGILKNCPGDQILWSCLFSFNKFTRLYQRKQERAGTWVMIMLRHEIVALSYCTCLSLVRTYINTIFFKLICQCFFCITCVSSFALCELLECLNFSGLHWWFDSKLEWLLWHCYIGLS